MDEPVAALFADESWLHALVRTEIALARAQARARIIPARAAAAIARRGKSFRADRRALAAAIRRDGFPILGLVQQLRAHVGGSAAAWVHWGATTQDILDSALVVQLDSALVLIEQHLAKLSAAFAALARKHRRTVMIGRTHLQPALPVSFGLKAAGWLAPLQRHRTRLNALRPRALVVACGGAAGTLASLGKIGPAVIAAFARELKLGVPPMPWHTQRDGLQEIAGWLSLVAASIEKFAHDILLLTQAEVGEVRETKDPARGGSSAMPQKSNPILTETILVAARAAAAEAAALRALPPPELERGTLNGQLEFLHLPRLCAFVGGALRAATQLANELQVDAARMRTNLDATHGTLLAEAAALALARHLSPAVARTLVREACARALTEKRHLIDILRSQTKAPVDWSLLRDASRQLGSTDVFIQNVLAPSTRRR